MMAPRSWYQWYGLLLCLLLSPCFGGAFRSPQKRLACLPSSLVASRRCAVEPSVKPHHGTLEVHEKSIASGRAPLILVSGGGNATRKVDRSRVIGSAIALAAAVGATFAGIDGVVERTLWSTLVACSGLAAYAYRDTIMSLLTGRSEGSLHLEPGRKKAFQAFQARYLFVQLIATFVDFVQGPYLYKVYESYGYGMTDIARLYLVGFLSSALAGPFAGWLADTYGRRTGCQLFAVLQSLSCALLHKNDYGILCLGRFLSGVATSFLSTCFECWMVSEHSRRAFPPQLLSGTFSAYVFFMGLVAVSSGAVAGYAERLYGVVAPFDVCIAAALLSFVVLPILWRPDNYGERKGASSSKASHTSTVDVFLGGKKEVLWVGLTQAFFEVAMFTWVFMWTPSLDTGEIANLNLGNVFSTLMLGTMVGSSLFSILTSDACGFSVDSVLLGALMVATACLGLSSLQVPAQQLLVLFVLYEACVGVYFAAVGTIRARFIPDATRAYTMNLIRLLLNVLIVGMYLGPVGLKLDMSIKKPLVLGLSAGLLSLSCVSHAKLMSTTDQKLKKV